LLTGDYRIDNGNNYCYAYLYMTNENDYIYVVGNFYTRAYNSHEGMLTAGTLEVKEISPRAHTAVISKTLKQPGHIRLY
jgi:hypothetical protein